MTPVLVDVVANQQLMFAFSLMLLSFKNRIHTVDRIILQFLYIDPNKLYSRLCLCFLKAPLISQLLHVS